MTAVALPRPRSARRTALWVVAALVVVAIGAGGAWLAALGEYVQRDALDPASRAPQGARAVAEVLADQGVEVEAVRTLDDARGALDAGGATLVVTDDRLLPADVLDELAGDADVLVDLSPDGFALDLLFDGSTIAAGNETGPVPAACDLAVVARAGEVALPARFTPAGAAVGCYPGAGGYGLLGFETGGGIRYAVDGRTLVANESIADGGRPALALALLGGTERVVWFVPSADDPALATGQTLGDVTPDWVTPAIVVLLAAAAVAMVWRGRRFGPLVAETLPVTVRASETTAGRARLYARAGDALHAADQLRIAAATRLARMLSLAPSASIDAVVDAAAARLGADRGAVAAVLVGDLPATDRDLVDLAARIDHLEAAVRAAVTPGRTP